MHYVYVLKVNSPRNQYYIGTTGDLRRRFAEHLRGGVKTTKRLKDPILLYDEAYSNSDLATEREQQLKRFGSAYVALLKRLGLR